MPIQSFNIANAKIVHKAFCDHVPKLMIIAGPNGVGKSTLLYELRTFSGDRVKGTGKILYVGPHRVWRRRNIKSTWLWGEVRQYFNILTQDTLPGVEGIGVQDRHRRPDGIDEAPGVIKFILAQIETRRQNAIVSELDRKNLKYPEGYAPDVYKPLRDMIETLLPHLHFEGISQKDRGNVTCLLRVKGVQNLIDIDDLSSGEKEVIALLMPLLERQIDQIIRRMEREKEPDLDVTPDTIILLDEPDLHIHPDLQRRMLNYIRKRAYEDDVQFVIATHSPVIINEATSDELFALVTKDMAGDANQLRRVLTSQERLDLFKHVCGDVAILTLGRPIVFLEGRAPDETRNDPSDQRILELLWEGARDFTFVPMGGREEVAKATMLLNKIMAEKLVGFPVYAILDADLDINIEPSSRILRWKCCTIENALLDPVSISEVLQPYKEKAGISTRDEVEEELVAICRHLMPDEIDRRLRPIVPAFHWHFKGRSMEELARERDAGMEQLGKHFIDQEEIDARIQRTTQEVQSMILDKTAFQKFNGKAILGKFYQKIISGKGIGMRFDVLCYSIAERIGRNGRTPESVKNALTSIQELFEAHSTPD